VPGASEPRSGIDIGVPDLECRSVVLVACPACQSEPMSDQRIEVERAIAAEPGAIFEILRSPEGHVQIDASGMLMSSSGEAASAVGDTFVVHMDRDALNDFDLGEYDVTVVISEFEQDRRIAWTIDGTIQPPIGQVYGYRLEPIEGGTTVTSFYDWSDLHENYRELAAEHFPIISETNLRATLGILARTVAPGEPRPGA
jgi:hypothetical protein